MILHVISYIARSLFSGLFWAPGRERLERSIRVRVAEEHLSAYSCSRDSPQQLQLQAVRTAPEVELVHALVALGPDGGASLPGRPGPGQVDDLLQHLRIVA